MTIQQLLENRDMLEAQFNKSTNDVHKAKLKAWIENIDFKIMAYDFETLEPTAKQGG